MRTRVDVVDSIYKTLFEIATGIFLGIIVCIPLVNFIMFINGMPEQKEFEYEDQRQFRRLMGVVGLVVFIIEVIIYSLTI